MTAVASSIDHTQLNFQTTSRNRSNRDRKNEGKICLYCYIFIINKFIIGQKV